MVETENIKRQAIAAFCGVGNPDSFFEHLRRDGYSLVFAKSFTDHHRYQQTDIDTLIAHANSRGCSALITTAKDATKLVSLKFDLPCHVLDVRIAIDDEGLMLKLIRKSLAVRKPDNNQFASNLAPRFLLQQSKMFTAGWT